MGNRFDVVWEQRKTVEKIREALTQCKGPRFGWGEAEGYGGHQPPLALSVNSRMGSDCRKFRFISGSVKLSAISRTTFKALR